jgi:hypothetical protein
MASVTPAEFTAFLAEFDLTRRQAGELLGRSSGMVSHWEKGRKAIPDYVTKWMADCRTAGEAVEVKKAVQTPPLPKENRKKIDLENHPEAEAEAIDTLTDVDFARLADAARACGLNPKTANHLVKRLRTRLLPVATEIKRYKTQEFLAFIEDRMMRSLEYLDDVALANASGRDLAVIFGIMADKRQLLNGEPTQILSFQDRRKLNDLIPLVLQEAQRRGLTIDLPRTSYAVVQEGK